MSLQSAFGEERRRFARRAVDASAPPPVELGTNCRGSLVDLGEAGAAVDSLVSLPAGTFTPVEIRLPGSKPIRVGGVVAWTRGSRAGIRFVDVDPDTADGLREWVLYGSALNVAHAQDARYDSVLHDAMSATRACGCAIATSIGSMMVCRASAGEAPDVGVVVNPRTGLAGECVRTGQVVVCNDARTDGRIDRLAAIRLGIASSVVVPIRRGESVTGLIQVFSSTSSAFGPEAVDALLKLANQLREDVPSAVQDDFAPLTADLEAVYSKPSDEPLPSCAPAPVAHAIADATLFAQIEEPERTFSGSVLKVAGGVGLIILVGIGIWLYTRRSTTPSAITAATSTMPSNALTERPLDASQQASELSEVSTAQVLTTRSASRRQEPLVILPGSAPNQSPPEFDPPTLQLDSPKIPSLELPAATLPVGPRATAAAPTVARQTETARSPTVTEARLLKRVLPRNPGIPNGGQVVLKAVIGANGHVQRIEVISGHPRLVNEARDAVSQWRYEPSRVDGRAVESEATITLKFAPG